MARRIGDGGPEIPRPAGLTDDRIWEMLRLYYGLLLEGLDRDAIRDLYRTYELDQRVAWLGVDWNAPHDEFLGQLDRAETDYLHPWVLGSDPRTWRA